MASVLAAAESLGESVSIRDELDMVVRVGLGSCKNLIRGISIENLLVTANIVVRRDSWVHDWTCGGRFSVPKDGKTIRATTGLGRVTTACHVTIRVGVERGEDLVGTNFGGLSASARQLVWEGFELTAFARVLGASIVEAVAAAEADAGFIGHAI